jgi:small multidrug resistance pump
MVAWIYLALAISTEVFGTVALRYTDGFTKLAPSAGALLAYGFSFWMLALVLKELEVSLVYAVWAGIGTAAIALIGIAALGESVNALKLLSIGLVIAGVVGLNLSGAS